MVGKDAELAQMTEDQDQADIDGLASRGTMSNLAPLSEVRFSLGLRLFGRAVAALAALSVARLGTLPARGWRLGHRAMTVVGLAAVGLELYALGLSKRRRRLQSEALIKPIMASLR